MSLQLFLPEYCLFLNTISSSSTVVDNIIKLFPPVFSQSPTQVFTDDTGFKIFVGSAIHAQNVPALRDIGISYIVNMAAGDLHTSQDFYGDDFHCLMISASDLEVYDLSQHFTEVSEFIEEARAAKTGVLVHCMAGVSRSVTVAVSYLMKW